MKRIPHAPTPLAIALLLALPPQAQALDAPRLAPSQSDYGGTGLLQMPSGRMAPEGEFSVHLSTTDSPYNRLAVSIQPLEWLESTIRYTEITNRLYGPEELSGDQTYKDKGLDLKIRLLREGYYLPELSVGIRDTAGTGLFGSEFLAASKRFYDIDVTLGLGWGYLGNQQHISNPLGKLSDKFYHRPSDAGGEQGGKLATNAFFRGEYAAFFGGIEYHTPWRPLRLKLEYDSNDYRHEPKENHQEQKSPINFGAVYRVGDWLDIHAGYERGDTWMLGFTLRTNFQGDIAQPKTDPKPEAVTEQTPIKPASFSELAAALDKDGLKVHRIRTEPNDTLAIYGEEFRYRDQDKATDRAARIATNRTPDSFAHLAFIDEAHGLTTTRTTLDREVFDAYARFDADDFGSTTRREQKTENPGRSVYARDGDAWDLDFYPDLNQSIGGPDDFYLYQITANASTDYQIAPGWELSSSLSANVVNNFDQFDYTAPSNLPRVRTFIREYLKGSDVNLRNLQLTHFRRLSENVYSQIYAGYLEFMYAGIGGELLYFPNDSDWALSANVNALRQREFEQHFGFRDYETTTGLISAYYKAGMNGVLAKLSVGRYLAKDDGITIDLSREFSSGVIVGVFATFTNVSAEDYGEGSFTKGFYLSMPFDVFFTRSSTRRGRLTWTPLTRDGGQPLNRIHELYSIYR